MRKDDHSSAKHIKTQGALQGMYSRAGIQQPFSRAVANVMLSTSPFAADHVYRGSNRRGSFRRPPLHIPVDTSTGYHPEADTD
jgi:hypothetical protein